MAESVYLTVGEVLQIHHQLIKDYGGNSRGAAQRTPGVRVFRPQIGYYNNIAEEAAALMESLANNPPFLDGNKRVALATAHTFLLVNGFDLEVDPLEAYDFMMQSIAGGEFRFAPILKWN